MKVLGLSLKQLGYVEDSLGVVFEGKHRERDHWAFRVVPTSVEGNYVRYGYMEYERKDGTKYRKRIRAICYHGWRDVTMALFEAGATKVQTSWGKWMSLADFNEDLPRLKEESKGRTDICTCFDNVPP